MFWTKLATATVVTVTLGLVGVGSASLLGAAPGPKAQAFVATLPMDDKDRMIEQLKKELMSTREREAQMRQQMEQMAKEQRAAKEFLEKSVLVVESARADVLTRQKQAEEARMQALEAEARVREIEKRARMEAEQQLKERRANEERSRKQKLERLDQYQVAQEVLLKEIEKLADAMAQHEEQFKKVSTLNVQLQHLNSKQAEVTDLLERARSTSGEDSRSVKGFVQQLELVEKSRKLTEKELETQNNRGGYSAGHIERYKAQLKVREKLLLELDEKLLRAKLGLD